MKWFLDRLFQRGICFGGGGGGGSNEVPETEAQRASAEIAMKNYNDYMSVIRPFEGDYIDDVSADTTDRQAQVSGQINADISQKVGTPLINPNKGMAPSSVSALATTAATAKQKGMQAVQSQKAAGMQSVIDMGMGKATTAQLGMNGLARQSVTEAVSDTDAQMKSENAAMSAGATGVMAAAGMAKTFYDDSKK